MGQFSTRKKRGRPPKLERIVQPCERVIERRELYGFVVPTKGPDGRGGSIDQDICDGIGQLQALGLLDGYGADPQDMRDKGRQWASGYAALLRRSGFKTGSYERMDKARHEVSYTRRDEAFDAMDSALKGFERSCLLSLLVDPIVGSFVDGRENATWVEAFICEGLIQKGKIPPHWMQPIRFPDSYDRDKMEAAIRGLVMLVEGQSMRRAA